MCKSQDGSLHWSSCVLDIQRFCYIEGKSQRSWANLLLFNSLVSCKIFSALGFLLVTIIVTVNMKTMSQLKTKEHLCISRYRTTKKLDCLRLLFYADNGQYKCKNNLKGTKPPWGLNRYHSSTCSAIYIPWNMNEKGNSSMLFVRITLFFTQWDMTNYRIISMSHK